MTHRVGAKGQVVIPKPIRNRLGIEPGDEVVFDTDGREVRMRRRKDDMEARAARIDALVGLLADGPSTEDLMAARREERELEERKAARWGVGRP
jgi:antitoxin PrlF